MNDSPKFLESGNNKKDQLSIKTHAIGKMYMHNIDWFFGAGMKRSDGSYSIFNFTPMFPRGDIIQGGYIGEVYMIPNTALKPIADNCGDAAGSFRMRAEHYYFQLFHTEEDLIQDGNNII